MNRYKPMHRSVSQYTTLGLETRDMRVYEALYRLEKGSLRSIAQATGMNRGTVYEVIKKLTDIGLVSFTPLGTRKYYNAADPEVFNSLIREQRERLQQLESDVPHYIQSLRGQGGGVAYMATFYEGDDGVASILRDVLQTVQELPRREYAVVSSQRVSAFLYTNFKSFTRQRIKMGIFVRVLSDVPAGEKSASLSERRQLPGFSRQSSGYSIVYGGKVALLSLDDLNRISGIVITDEGIARMQQSMFEQLWEVTHG